MYTLLNVVEDAEKRAESVAFDDRLHYSKFIGAAEAFANNNGLIVGGAAANRLLLGDPSGSGTPAPIDFSSFRYEFYSAQAVQHARALADALYAADPEVRGRYTTMRTKVPDASLSVEVDGRDMFLVAALKVRRGIRMADVMIPSLRPAQFAKDAKGSALMLQCSGPEIQLIEVYTALCNPAKASSWGGLLAVEAGLRKIFDSEIQAKLTEAVGNTRRAKTFGGGIETQSMQSQSEKLVRALRTQYASGASRVVVGCGAATLIAEATGARAALRMGAANHLQVVSVGPLESEAEEIIAIAHRIGCEVQWTVGDPTIPIDPRLRRMSVHLVADTTATRRELVLEVYNAAAHELIPYITVGTLLGAKVATNESSAMTGGAHNKTGHRPHYRTQDLAWHLSELPMGLKIGTPFAVMRFRLADMWTIQMLLKMDIIDSGYAKGALNAILADYNTVSEAYGRILTGNDTTRTAEICLPMEDYIGRFEDPEIAQKRAAQSGPNVKFHQPYMPLLRSRSEHGRLGSARLRSHDDEPDGYDSENDLIEIYSD